MAKLTKLCIAAVLIAAAISILSLWFQTFVIGGYYANAGAFLVTLGVVAPVVLVVAAFKAVRWIFEVE